MNFLIDSAWAQSAPAQSNPYGFLIMMGLFFVIFYFMLIRPQSKRAKEHRAMVAGLSAGDEVVTGGGLIGKITEVHDTYITLEIASGVQVKVQKVQVTGLVPAGTLKG